MVSLFFYILNLTLFFGRCLSIILFPVFIALFIFLLLIIIFIINVRFIIIWLYYGCGTPFDLKRYNCFRIGQLGRKLITFRRNVLHLIKI